MSVLRLYQLMWGIAFLFCTHNTVQAQQLFSEGVITYKVRLEPKEGEGGKEHTGTYTLTIKGKQLKKELKMDNGFATTILHDENNHIAYILKLAGDKKYAVQLDNDQLKKSTANFEGLSLTRLNEKEMVSGIEGRKGVVIYLDKSSTEIIYSDVWKPDRFVYDRFPGIEVLPLAFTIATDEGVILHFRVKDIETTLVENSNFKIPEDYKIITNAEYRQLK